MNNNDTIARFTAAAAAFRTALDAHRAHTAEMTLKGHQIDARFEQRMIDARDAYRTARALAA